MGKVIQFQKKKPKSRVLIDFKRITDPNSLVKTKEGDSMAKVIQIKKQAKGKTKAKPKEKAPQAPVTEPKKEVVNTVVTVSPNVAVYARYIKLQTRVDALESSYKKACEKTWTEQERKELDAIYQAHLHLLLNPPPPPPKGEY
jgi:serine/threonine-protein kinase RIO1